MISEIASRVPSGGGVGLGVPCKRRTNSSKVILIVTTLQVYIDQAAQMGLKSTNITKKMF